MNLYTDKNLIGKWIIDPQDIESINKYGRTSLEFSIDGRLIYTIHSNNREQIILLNYRTQEGKLITNQPSAPREEITIYELQSNKKLILVWGGHKSTYIRQDGMTL